MSMELGMLIAANLLIKTRLPPKPKSMRPSLLSFAEDFTFMSFIIGYRFFPFPRRAEASS